MVLRLVLLLLLCLLPAPAPARPQSAAVAERHMLAVAHPLAAEAGLAVLRAGRRRGGRGDRGAGRSDAGGAAILRHRRRRAPAALGRRGATPFRLGRAGGGAGLGHAGAVPARRQADAVPRAAVGGRAVGVPGALRMLEAAHRAHGRMPWPRLFERRDRARRGRFRCFPAPCRDDRAGSGASRPRPGCARAVPAARRVAVARRASPAQPGTGRDLARSGGGRRRCAASRADRRGDRRSRAGACRTPAE